MANLSLSHSAQAMNILAALGVSLEQVEALTLVALDEDFIEHGKEIVYPYFSVLESLIQQAKALHAELLVMKGGGL